MTDLNVTDTDFIMGYNNIAFYPLKHKYRNDTGRWLPPVTKILEHLGITDYRGVDRYYADRGSRVHKLVEMELRGKLNRDMIEEDELLYFDGFTMWWNERKESWKLLHTEMILANNIYAGTVDAVFEDENGRIIVVDWKTSSVIDESHKLQIEAYSQLLATVGIYPAEKRIVQFKKDGTYGETITYDEYAVTWKKLVHLSKHKRPLVQKKFMAYLITSNIHAIDRNFAAVTAKTYDNYKKYEAEYKKSKELLKTQIGNDMSGYAELEDGRTFYAMLIHKGYSEIFNIVKFFAQCEQELDMATVRALRKIYRHSMDIKTRESHSRIVIKKGEDINLPLKMRSEKTATEIASEIMLMHPKSEIETYMKSIFGDQWTDRNLKRYRGDISKFIEECINSCRQALEMGDIGEFMLPFDGVKK